MGVEGALRVARARLGAAEDVDESGVAAQGVEPGVAHEEWVAEEAAIDGSPESVDRLVALFDARQRAAHVVQPFAIGKVAQRSDQLEGRVDAALDHGAEHIEDAETE